MRVAFFVADVTPPVGSPLGMGLYPPTTAITDPLNCSGCVLYGDGDPIVLCALDWFGISGSGHARWRTELAHAASTSPQRVAVHTLHQHDAPGYNPDAEQLMASVGLAGRVEDAAFADLALQRVTSAVRASTAHLKTITTIGLGMAKVTGVASNRRVLGQDGRVAHVRYSATKDRCIRAAPEGLVDPFVRVISFWDEDELVGVLSYYATHPQSHYREGLVTCDFVGLARAACQRARPRLPHVHFCGAAGNITAGKYNDGSPDNRFVLASRLSDGMSRAIDDSALHRNVVTDGALNWDVRDVFLPFGGHIAGGPANELFEHRPCPLNAIHLASTTRSSTGSPWTFSCLRLGSARVLHLPGEPFVEYQLAAQRMRSDLFVATAAYSDLALGYLCTQVAYDQGGYEPGMSYTAPEAETAVVSVLGELLDAPAERRGPIAYPEASAQMTGSP